MANRPQTTTNPVKALGQTITGHGRRIRALELRPAATGGGGGGGGVIGGLQMPSYLVAGMSGSQTVGGGGASSVAFSGVSESSGSALSLSGSTITVEEDGLYLFGGQIHGIVGGTFDNFATVIEKNGADDLALTYSPDINGGVSSNLQSHAVHMSAGDSVELQAWPSAPAGPVTITSATLWGVRLQDPVITSGGGGGGASDYRFHAWGPVYDVNDDFHVIHSQSVLEFRPDPTTEIDPSNVFDAATGLYLPPAGDYLVFFELFVDFNPGAGGTSWVEVGLEHHAASDPANVWSDGIGLTQKVRIPNDGNDYRVAYQAIVSYDGSGGIRPTASAWANNAGLSRQRNQCNFGGYRLGA